MIPPPGLGGRAGTLTFLLLEAASPTLRFLQQLLKAGANPQPQLCPQLLPAQLSATP